MDQVGISGSSETIRVETSHPRGRLDTYLTKQFPRLSRGAIQRLIEQAAIRVDGHQAKPTHRPRAGEEITIEWPEPESPEAKPQAIALDILFEDEDLVVLNKAPGMVMHPSAGHREQTLVNALLYHCGGHLSGIGGVARPGIVHRLDKETSGCLVIAKNDETHHALARQFANREVEKTYQALVCGAIEQDSGDIRAAIARHPNHRKRMAVSEGKGNGRDAWTSFRVKERFPDATWVEAFLHTGRTHQIRVHFLHIGHPLVGDSVYGKRVNHRLRERTGYVAPRQMLHAETLAFIHPRTGKPMALSARLPEDWRAAVRAMSEMESGE